MFWLAVLISPVSVFTQSENDDTPEIPATIPFNWVVTLLVNVELLVTAVTIPVIVFEEIVPENTPLSVIYPSMESI